MLIKDKNKCYLFNKDIIKQETLNLLNKFFYP
jgi:hypothetical protein